MTSPQTQTPSQTSSAPPLNVRQKIAKRLDETINALDPETMEINDLLVAGALLRMSTTHQGVFDQERMNTLTAINNEGMMGIFLRDPENAAWFKNLFFVQDGIHFLLSLPYSHSAFAVSAKSGQTYDAFVANPDFPFLYAGKDLNAARHLLYSPQMGGVRAFLREDRNFDVVLTGLSVPLVRHVYNEQRNNSSYNDPFNVFGSRFIEFLKSTPRRAEAKSWALFALGNTFLGGSNTSLPSDVLRGYLSLLENDDHLLDMLPMFEALKNSSYAESTKLAAMIADMDGVENNQRFICGLSTYTKESLLEIPEFFAKLSKQAWLRQQLLSNLSLEALQQTNQPIFEAFDATAWTPNSSHYQTLARIKSENRGSYLSGHSGHLLFALARHFFFDPDFKALFFARRTSPLMPFVLRTVFMQNENDSAKRAEFFRRLYDYKTSKDVIASLGNITAHALQSQKIENGARFQFDGKVLICGVQNERNNHNNNFASAAFNLGTAINDGDVNLNLAGNQYAQSWALLHGVNVATVQNQSVTVYYIPIPEANSETDAA